MKSKKREHNAKTKPPKRGEKRGNITKEQPDPQHSEAYLRLYAEFENYKKNQIKRQKAYIEQAQKRVIVPMIAVLQDLNRFQNPPTPLTTENLQEAMKIIHNKLWQTLAREGVGKIDVQQGAALNPTIHQVLGTQKLEKEGQEGTIAQVVQEGYTLDRQVIIPAQVIAYRSDE